MKCFVNTYNEIEGFHQWKMHLNGVLINAVGIGIYL